MRASPACQVVLKRFGVWRAAVTGLALLSVACIVSWLATRGSPITPGLVGSVIAATVGTIFLLRSLLRMPQRQLRWDGQVWHLATVPGELAVVVDLGAWMLLRFAPADSTRATRAVWLPVQRRGLEAQWHALRCAVYSPRPAPGQ